MSVSGAGASGQSAGPTGARGIAVKEGSAGMGGASARFAISTGLTAVRKTVGKEGFAGFAGTVSAGGEGSPPGRAVGGQGASAGCGVAEEKQRAAAASLEEPGPALAYATGRMRSS